MKRPSDKKLDKILKFHYPNFKEYTFQKKLEKNAFLVKSQNKQFVLKKYDQKITKERLQFFEELQNMTNAYMQISPQVLKTKDGNLNVHRNSFYYDLTEFVEGEMIQREQVKNISEFFYKIGLFVGKLHKSFSEIESKGQITMNSLLYTAPESPKHLVDLLDSYYKAQIDDSWKEIIKEKITIVNSYTDHLKVFNALPRKIVHGDLYLKNLLFDKSQKIIGLIDFVQAGVFFRCYEVIRALIQTNKFFQNTDIEARYIKQYLKGYLQGNSLDESEIHNMLDFYIYVQASDTAFLDIETIVNGGKEINEYAKYRSNSLHALFRNRHLLNEVIYKAK